jgi:hypothetical protein
VPLLWREEEEVGKRGRDGFRMSSCGSKHMSRLNNNRKSREG